MTTDSPATPDRAIEQLGRWRTDARSTLDVLAGYRTQIDGHAQALENPQAVLAYLDAFADIIGRASSDCERLGAELVQGVGRAHVETLRAMAAAGAAEQPRCLVFRDKWINKPLRQEGMRPLLNDISVTTRDQLTAFRELDAVAAMLDDLIGPEAPPQDEKKGFDRRALFTRLFKP